MEVGTHNSGHPLPCSLDTQLRATLVVLPHRLGSTVQSGCVLGRAQPHHRDAVDGACVVASSRHANAGVAEKVEECMRGGQVGA